MLLPLGFLRVESVRFLWLLLNIVLVFLVTHELYLLTGAGPFRWPLLLGLVTVWPASSYCIAREQYSLLVLWSVLVALRLESKFPIVSGLLYSIALLKPLLALPFLVLPLLAKRLTALATLAACQLALLATMCWWVRTSWIDLLKQWLSTAAYFRQGMYTAQDIINGLRLDGTVLDTASQLAIILVAFAVAYRLSFQKGIAFLAVVSCIWSYHALYDFCVILIPVALLIEARMNRNWILSAAALCVVALGLTQPIYRGTSSAVKAIRWATRLSLAVLVVSVTQIEFLGRPPASMTTNVDPSLQPSRSPL
jgi:hypothetical protein